MTDARDRTIYVATIIDSHNYGTVLQATATRDLLAVYGRSVFVDYTRPQWTRTGWVRSYMSAEGRSKLEGMVRLVANAPAHARETKLFRSFVERELELCDAAPFLTGGGAEKLDPTAAYVVGSDQTWNIECNYGIDPVYFLEHVPDSLCKMALSASFGRESLSDDEVALTRPLLEGFDAISVRESSSVAILDAMGIGGSVALKDPVLLCDPGLWHRLSENAKPVPGEGYVLAYMLNVNPEMAAYAARVAAERKVPAYTVTFNPLKRAPEGLRAVCLPTPEEWVALFRDAGLVVTDSFHGTCFSLVFNKPMAVFSPPRFSVRLHDVLADFGLLDRLAGGLEDALARDIAGEGVDWGRVNAAIDVERKRGRAFLGAVLGGDHD